ncbi:hypothetical protein SAMD00019534_023460 [Acytostelium subglobosum LB1]|uniref:hypothetical protein n=1 Tax=Acytostelium subglobosum LB1 TaxID=1410327 RepID=UPI000644FF8E|nr:hypothetical protein SAMD00019534_023460 [Acytostelium subglobosum LB1]GAM19171.1 hypothetical protein SAMD00019534_023460 [Acytostelium subglobosum LB1]|eukprot:XP_012757098.1 hypothetical protein SAMD00019534_023460 [Acytostelium subglobosum LB1]
MTDDTELTEQYNKLKDIYSSGFITEYEFISRKRELLGDRFDSFVPTNSQETISTKDDNTLNQYNYDNNSYNTSSSSSYDYNSNSTYNNSYNTYNNSYNTDSTSSYQYNQTQDVPDISYYQPPQPTTQEYNYNYNYTSHEVPVEKDQYTFAVVPDVQVEQQPITSYNYNHDQVVATTYTTAVVADDDYDDTYIPPVRTPSTTTVKPSTTSKVIQDKLTGKSAEKKEITYPHKVRDSYVMYKGQIDGVVLYYRTKEFLFQSDLIGMDQLDQVSTTIRAKFGFTQYSLVEIVPQTYVSSPPEHYTVSNSWEEGQTYHDPLSLASGHYRIVPKNFYMIRKWTPHLFGMTEEEYNHHNMFKLPPQHFITLAKSAAQKFIDEQPAFGLLDNTFNFYMTMVDLVPKHFIKHRSTAVDPNVNEAIKIKSLHTEDNKDDLNRKVNFLNQLRHKQGQNKMFGASSVLKAREIHIDRTLAQCIQERQCIVCGQGSYNSFLCSVHNDQKLVDDYHQLKDIIFPAKNKSDDDVEAEDVEPKPDIRDYKDEPSFCYAETSSPVLKFLAGPKNTRSFADVLKRRYDACESQAPSSSSSSSRY